MRISNPPNQMLESTYGEHTMKTISTIMLGVLLVTFVGCGTEDSDNNAESYDRLRCRLLSTVGARTLIIDGEREPQSSWEETCEWNGNTQSCVYEDGHTWTQEYNEDGYVVRYTEEFNDGETSQTVEYDCSRAWCRKISASGSISYGDTTDTFEIACEWTGNTQSCISDSGSTWTRDYNAYGYVVFELYESDYVSERSEFTYQCSSGWCGLTSLVVTTLNDGEPYVSHEGNCSWNGGSQQCSGTGYDRPSNGNQSLRYESSIIHEYACR
jgi:YD repeat-containing protein